MLNLVKSRISYSLLKLEIDYVHFMYLVWFYKKTIKSYFNTVLIPKLANYMDCNDFEALVSYISKSLVRGFNTLTDPVSIIAIWCIYVCISDWYNTTLFGAFTFISSIHSGTHRHSYIYRWMCPVILVKESANLICFLSDDFVFCICTLFVLLWSINERVISSYYCKSRLLSIYNLLLVINFFNPFKYCIIFHNCGSYNNHKFIYKKNVILFCKHLGFRNKFK